MTASELSGHFHQLSVSVRCYRGVHILPDDMAKTTVKSQDVDAERMTSSSVSLVPAHILDEFNAIANKRSALLKRYTIPLRLMDAADDQEADDRKPTRSLLNLRLMPLGSAADVLSGLNEVRRKMADWAEELKGRWQEEVVEYNRSYWKDRLGDADFQKLIMSCLPTVGELSNRYGLSIGVYEISAGPVHQVNDRETATLLREASAAAQQQIENAFAEMMVEPSRLVAAAAADLRQQLLNGAKLSDRTFNKFHEAADLIKAFAATSSADVLARVHDLRTLVERTKAQAGNRRTGLSYRDAVTEMLGPLADSVTALTRTYEVERTRPAAVPQRALAARVPTPSSATPVVAL